ncbi:hypothetical protein OROHE_013463 [Orobanche hederae]
MDFRRITGLTRIAFRSSFAVRILVSHVAVGGIVFELPCFFQLVSCSAYCADVWSDDPTGRRILINAPGVDASLTCFPCRYTREYIGILTCLTTSFSTPSRCTPNKINMKGSDFSEPIQWRNQIYSEGVLRNFFKPKIEKDKMD